MINVRMTTCLVVCALLPCTAFGQEAPAEMSEDEKSAGRMALMQGAAEKFSIHFAEENSLEANATDAPILRWANPHSRAVDGILTAFTVNERPVGVLQFAMYGSNSIIHEFHTFSEQPFELRRGDRVMWKADGPTGAFSKLDDAGAPRDTSVQRGIQMRQIAKRFEVWDDHGWNEPVKQQLRLLTQPVYRYADKSSDVVDGAVFVFGLSNDPEAVVVIEACQNDTEAWWQYCFSPVTVYALEAKCDGEVVWSVPERKVFGRGYQGQYVSPYRGDPGDPTLGPLLPAKD